MQAGVPDEKVAIYGDTDRFAFKGCGMWGEGAVPQTRGSEATCYNGKLRYGGMSASESHRYRSTADPQHELRLRLKELAAARVRYGYRRRPGRLRRESWPSNVKRGYRLDTEARKIA